MSVQLIRVGLVVTNSICWFGWVREDQVFDQTFHLACRPGKDNLPLQCELTSPNPNETCQELQFRRSSFSLSSWEGGTCHCLAPARSLDLGLRAWLTLLPLQFLAFRIQDKLRDWISCSSALKMVDCGTSWPPWSCEPIPVHVRVCAIGFCPSISLSLHPSLFTSFPWPSYMYIIYNVYCTYALLILICWTHYTQCITHLWIYSISLQNIANHSIWRIETKWFSLRDSTGSLSLVGTGPG